MVQGIQTVSPIQSLTQRAPQSFTPQISTSRIAEALLTRPQQTLETPLEAVGSVAQQLSGAFLARKADQRAQERQQAQISSIGDLARVLATPNLRTEEGTLQALSGGVTQQDIGPPGRIEQLQGIIAGAPSPEIAQQGLGFLQKEQAGPQVPGFSNITVDPGTGQAFGVNDTTGQFGPVPTAGQPQQPGGGFGAETRRIGREKVERERGKEKFKRTSDLRSETQRVSGDFNKQTAAFDRLNAVSHKPDGSLNQTPAAALGVVFNYMNILDPGVSVRKDDFDSVKNAVGWVSRTEKSGIPIPTVIKQSIQQIEGQGFLVDTQIQDLLDSGAAIVGSAAQLNAQQISPIIASARESGIKLNKLMPKSQIAAYLDTLTDEELDAFELEASRGNIK